MKKMKTYLPLLLILLQTILQAQIIDYYPRVDSLYIEGHCMQPEIILSEINGVSQDTLKIKCWSTVWRPKRIDDYNYNGYRGEDIFYVINDPENNNRYKVWIEEDNSSNQTKILVPFNEHLSFYFKYFKLKVCVFSEQVLVDSLVQYFESSIQAGIDEHVDQPVIDHEKIIKIYPNPFNSQTTISYQLSDDSFVSLKIYNSIGQEVEELISAFQTAGQHEVKWNPINLSTNTYFIKLTTQTTEIIKCTVIK